MNHISDTDLDGDAPLLGGAAEGLEGGAVEGAGRGQADGGEEERCSEHGDTRPELWQLAARSRVPSGFSVTDMLAMFDDNAKIWELLAGTSSLWGAPINT